MRTLLSLLSLLLIFSNSIKSQLVIVPYGSPWKYLDNGTNQGTAWRGTTFNDAAWASGNAQLGYGDGDEATVVSFGPNPGKKYITTYFRKTFSVSNPSIFTGFTLNLKRDDGAVVYINGTERFRTNMTTGNFSYTTKASALAADDGNVPQTVSLPAGILGTGNNFIAVEIHQHKNNNDDNDISFDLEFIGNGDFIAPHVTAYYPVDNAIDIPVTSNLVLTFNETVQKGVGNILVKENGITVQTIDVTSPTVSVAGNIVTIDPTNFTNYAAVHIEIDPGAFKDLSNNNYAGINDALTWDFTIMAPDIIPPLVTAYNPSDNSTNASVSGNLMLTFNEDVQKGFGNILIKEAGITTQIINVNSSFVSVSGNAVTINPCDLGYNKAVHIEIDPGAFTDLVNNNYAGIAGAVTWNFTTETVPTGPQTFIPFGSIWKYFATGAAPTGSWKNLGYDDSSWPSGAGQLGYGDGDEVTCVPSGGGGTLCLPSGNKWITTYFRKEITIANPSAFSSIAGSVYRDDGIVVYVNGSEVYRNNMPTGTVSYSTLAAGDATDDGSTPQNFTISSSAFVSGNNIIAVEVHQRSASSSDFSFDLQLVGSVPGVATLTRGPYMNMALQNSIVIRWRSSVATNSKVNYGAAGGCLNQSAIDNTVTTEHVVTLTGLTPNTLYYYSIGSTTHKLQGDANNYFKTMPVPGSTQKIRVMAMGDMGNNSANQVNVRNAWLAFNGSNYTDAWILLGDNAYSNGTETEYQTNFFNIYQGSLTKNHVLWPAPGNHDYAQSSARQADHLIPYYDMFTLPANGQGGGIPSNSEAFYSYNYGNVHFVALDSYGWEAGNTRLYDTSGPQAVWLKQDLAANTMPWTVVYFHHPPYTKGSHDSDNETELINMRQRVVPIFERYKVDLVLCGHSHSYERSYLINGHYGVETSFNAATHALSTSSAKYNGSSNSCTYIKNPTDIRNGIVYALVGSAGQLGGTSSGYPHNAMYYSNVSNGGTLYFEIENNKLAAKWVGADGVIRDNFTIMKNVNKTNAITISSGNSVTLTASWIGNYSWSTNETTKSITVSPTANTTYTVTDGMGCLTDVFNVVVTGTLNRPIVQEEEEKLMNVYPTLLQKGQVINISAGFQNDAEFILTDIGGRIFARYKYSPGIQIPTDMLVPGLYFLAGKAKDKIEVTKIVIQN